MTNKEETKTMSENARTIKDICKAYGLSQAELSRKYGIPIRTVEDWHAGRRTPPAYVVNMLSDLLDYEREKNPTSAESSDGVPSEILKNSREKQ